MFRIAFAIALFLVNACASAFSCPGREPQAALVVSVSDMLERKAYAELETANRRYREQEQFSEAGNLTLNAFYDTVGAPLVNCQTVNPNEAAWIARRAVLRGWLKSKPNSVGAQVALGAFQVRDAYFARGNGFAHTVSDIARKRFKERMAEARRMLEKMAPGVREDPWWYKSMLMVAVAQGWPEPAFAALLKEGTAKFPLAYRLYQEGAEYYSSKWYGNDAALLRYIEETAAETSPRMGQTMYMKLHAHANGNFNSMQIASWERVQAGHQRIIQDFPAKFNVNKYAEAACMFQKYDVLLEQFDELGNAIDRQAWNNPRIIDMCMNAVAQLEKACRKPALQQAMRKQALRHLREKEFAQLNALWASVRGKDQLAPDGLRSLNNFYAALGIVYQRCGAEAQDRAGWDERERQLDAWRAATPDVPGAGVAHAFFLSRYALNRKHGPEDDAKGWALYNDRARAALEALPADARDDPVWYETMARIAMESGWPEPRFSAVLMEGLERHPGSAALVMQGGLRTLQFSGPHAQTLAAYADTMVAREDAIMYARLYRGIKSHDSKRARTLDPLRVQAGLEQLVQKYPDLVNRDMYANWLCQDAEKNRAALKVLFDGLGDHADLRVWGSWEQLSSCKAQLRQ